ncbi:MAG: hypothetical protein QOJ98_108 [Acidobacteriota bacterium]|jgi:hypothetical protein|nr:hypothetical protein [Acidobacteriota bacterium]
MENDCRSCYRPIAEGRTHCVRCASESRSQAISAPLMLAAGAALATLAAGMLSLNIRLCFAGAVVAGVATLIHVVQSVR